MPTPFYEPDIGPEAIVSYEWLTIFGFVLNPGLHGMMRKIKSSGALLHFPGNQLRTGEVAAVARLDNASIRDTPRRQRNRPNPPGFPDPPDRSAC